MMRETTAGKARPGDTAKTSGTPITSDTRSDPMNARAGTDDTETFAFALRMKPGAAAEYRRRHDELWPEMRALLLGAGILHYEIFLHEESSLLFAHIVRRRDHSMDRLPDSPVQQRWQRHMSDILLQRDGKPVRDALAPMFRLSAAD